MWEYIITHKVMGEQNIIFGYSQGNAFKRANLNPNDYYCDQGTYAD